MIFVFSNENVRNDDTTGTRLRRENKSLCSNIEMWMGVSFSLYVNEIDSDWMGRCRCGRGFESESEFGCDLETATFGRIAANAS